MPQICHGHRPAAMRRMRRLQHRLQERKQRAGRHLLVQQDYRNLGNLSQRSLSLYSDPVQPLRQCTLRAGLPDPGHAQAGQRHHHARSRKMHRLQVLRVQLPLRGHLLQLAKPHPFWRDEKASDRGRYILSGRGGSQGRRQGDPLLQPGTRMRPCPASGPRAWWKNAPSAITGSKKGILPRCVEACPADARIFGDISDPNSKVSKLLGKFRPFRLREQLGTESACFLHPGFQSGQLSADQRRCLNE